jgi:hypothetical protein
MPWWCWIIVGVAIGGIAALVVIVWYFIAFGKSMNW